MQNIKTNPNSTQLLNIIKELFPNHSQEEIQNTSNWISDLFSHASAITLNNIQYTFKDQTNYWILTITAPNSDAAFDFSESLPEDDPELETYIYPLPNQENSYNIIIEAQI